MRNCGPRFPVHPGRRIKVASQDGRGGGQQMRDSRMPIDDATDEDHEEFPIWMSGDGIRQSVPWRLGDYGWSGGALSLPKVEDGCHIRRCRAPRRAPRRPAARRASGPLRHTATCRSRAWPSSMPQPKRTNPSLQMPIPHDRRPPVGAVVGGYPFNVRTLLFSSIRRPPGAVERSQFRNSRVPGMLMLQVVPAALPRRQNTVRSARATISSNHPLIPTLLSGGSKQSA